MNSNTVGFYFCDDVAGTGAQGRCDQGYVNLRSTTYGSDRKMRALACHEIGHAIGLLHPDDSSPAKSRTDTRFQCMMNAPSENYPFLGSDPNVANINSVY